MGSLNLISADADGGAISDNEDGWQEGLHMP